MDNRPIGVFDSGLGGLTAVRQLMRVMPDQPLIFFGDTGRLPYGGRSRDALIKYTKQDINFIRSFDIKLIVAACGTVSTTSLEAVRDEVPLPLVGVVEPTAASAVSTTRCKRIGVIGTAATIRSGAYERHILNAMPEAEIFSRACPLFVPLVENGRYKKDDIVVKEIVSEYLTPLREAGVDTLILGCTHYPLLMEAIGEFMGPNVTLIDSGKAVADHVASILNENDLVCEGTAGGCSFYVSDSVDDFSALASMFLGMNVSGSVEGVDITRY